MFKKVYSLYSAFYPSLRFTLSLQSAFYTQSAFYPWSAICSPQSAVRSLRFTLNTNTYIHTLGTSRSDDALAGKTSLN